MAIRKTPAKPKIKSPIREAARLEAEANKVACYGCGTRKKPAEFLYEITSLLDPSEFCCSDACQQKWADAHPTGPRWPVAGGGPREKDS